MQTQLPEARALMTFLPMCTGSQNPQSLPILCSRPTSVLLPARLHPHLPHRPVYLSLPDRVDRGQNRLQPETL
jgi:hypothetical protein